MPTRVSEKPQILNLQELISLKLSSYMGSPIMLLNGKSTADKVRNIEKLQHFQRFQQGLLDIGGAAGFSQECRLFGELLRCRHK